MTTETERAAPPGLVARVLRRPVSVVCLAYLAVLAGVAIVAPILLPDVAGQQAGDLAAVREGPGAGHWLGTDSLGRDVLDRLLVGARPTLLGIGQAVVTVLLLGVPLGLLAGYLGGWTDRVVTWLADLTFALPSIVIVLLVLAIFPQSMTAAMVAFGVIAAPSLMRVVRSAVLPIREELYVAAARVSGLTGGYIMVRHILPRVAGAVIVQTSLLAGVALLVQTGLGFLNLVVAAPAPSWGGMVADGMSVLQLQPWLIVPAGLTIATTVLALGLFGDALRDAATEGWAAAPARRPRRSGRVAVRPSAAPRPGDGPPPLLRIEGLHVAFPSPAGPVPVLQDVGLTVERGETVGLVGESGCGKTTVAMAVVGLLAGGGRIEAGRIEFDGTDLAALDDRRLQAFRGRRLGLISQEPMIAMNPAFRIGWQLAEAVRRHHGGSRSAVRQRVLELLRQVRLPDPEAVARAYPHQLSGGMAQRVAIARALAGEPDLLIADEPTTALDVTVQAEILDLLRELRRARGMAILLVTHDWGVVADSCDRAVVMYAGQVVEQGGLEPLFGQPRHPYTRALLAANPALASGEEALPTIEGTVPKPGSWPEGCHFRTRCPLAGAGCDQPIPLLALGGDHHSRCIRHEDPSRPALSTAKEAR